LTAQVPRIFELLDLFGVPVIGLPGLEADDIIATITRRLLSDPALDHINIRIVSRDKDFEQLLSQRVTLFDIHTDTTIDLASLLRDKSITPQQVVDLLALTGDSVDNVPGVEGIGPKTAAQLIQQFGSIDGIFANIDQIKGKRRENLEKARATLPLSRTLVTLKSDAEFPFSLEAARVRPLKVEKILGLFQQLGFNRYQEELRRLAGESIDLASSPGGQQQFRLGDEERGTPLPNLQASEEATDRVTGTSAVDSYSPATADYQAITTPAQLEKLVAILRSQELVSVDTETTSRDQEARLCGVSFSWKPRQGVYVPIFSPRPAEHLSSEAVLEALRPVLEDGSILKCGHNLKFDALTLLRCSIRLRGVVSDSMLASALIDARQPSHKLDNLALQLLNYRMIPITDLIGEDAGQSSMESVPLEKAVPYSAENTDIALRLHHYFLPRLQEMGLTQLLQDVEAPLAPVIAGMEANGILCDPDELLRQGEVLSARVAELNQEIKKLAECDFDLDSTQQLADVLFKRLGLTPGKRTKTGHSTDIQVLEKLASEEDSKDLRTSIPRLIIEYRQLTKLISTYLGNLRSSINPKTGRIHSTFHQLLTATGRLASQGPNLQNIPVRSEVGRLIRKAFIAPPGHRLICADYSQIELRVLAHLSEDAALIEAFERDLDIHTAVASQVFGVPPPEITREQRGFAKTINFGIIYGITPFGLARRIEGLDVGGATRLIADYKRRFPGIDLFLQRCVHHAIDRGYVATIMGRRRAIPEVQSTSATTRNLGERLAINSVVQGSAADLIKIAMVNVQKRIDREHLPLKLLLQIHDELVLESPEEGSEEYAAIVREEMENAMKLKVPLRADAGIGPDWMSAK
jgi:DNA polymerase-1